jgi:hypothetical protein
MFIKKFGERMKIRCQIFMNYLFLQTAKRIFIK